MAIRKINIGDSEIAVILGVHDDGYICLTDMVKAGDNSERTDAIGIISKAGRYGGTYAHKDIAYHFGMWLSPEFNLLVIKEFDRLKAEEQKQIGWSAKRELSKINYRIHTDAIKQNLIPEEVTQHQASIIYAEEADVLNVAMFGKTATVNC